MDSMPTASCGFPRQAMTQEFCEQTLSIDRLLKSKIKSDGRDTPEKIISLELGTIKKFEYFGKYADVTPADLATL